MSERIECPHCGENMELRKSYVPHRTEFRCRNCRLSGPAIERQSKSYVAEVTRKAFGLSEPEPKPMKPYFMVKGDGPTSYTHGTFSDAYREAQRLAMENKGHSFDVMMSIRRVQIEAENVTDFDIQGVMDELKDDFPF